MPYINAHGQTRNWTPFRRGQEAGRIHGQAFRAWKVLPLGERGPAPQPPPNPYTNLRSCNAWGDGYSRALRLNS